MSIVYYLYNWMSAHIMYVLQNEKWLIETILYLSIFFNTLLIWYLFILRKVMIVIVLTTYTENCKSFFLFFILVVTEKILIWINACITGHTPKKKKKKKKKVICLFWCIFCQRVYLIAREKKKKQSVNQNVFGQWKLILLKVKAWCTTKWTYFG